MKMKNGIEQEIRELEDNKDMDGSMKKVVTYYQACLDINDTLEIKRAKPLLEIMNQTGIGMWPIMEENPKISITGQESFQRKMETLIIEYQVILHFIHLNELN